jgi:hypothetical protein
MTEERPNRSPIIDSMNRHVGNPLGVSYCAAAGYWWLDNAGVSYPQQRSGLARSFKNSLSFSVMDVLNHKRKILAGYGLVWQKGNTIYGHFAFASEDWQGSKGKTIEGNTSSGTTGSQSNGDGFFNRDRRIEPYNYFRIKWITPIATQD